VLCSELSVSRQPAVQSVHLLNYSGEGEAQKKVQFKTHQPQFTCFLLLPVKPYYVVSFSDHEGHFPEVDSLRQNRILKATRNAKR